MATNRLVGAFDSVAAWWNYLTISLQRQEDEAVWADQYNMLRAYYLNNGLYEVLESLLDNVGAPSPKLRPLRNPAFRVVEFYAAKLWPGDMPDALPIVTENDAIVEPIQQVWKWSNWGAQKQTAARWFATYGDMFLKVSTKAGTDGRVRRVYIQNLEPQIVTAFDVDERNYLEYVRLDIPQSRRKSDGKIENYTRTELWTKQQYTVWEHDKETTVDLGQLGTPIIDVPLGAFGIDFVPIVWQPFRDVGDERGAGAFTLSIDKIDEANRQATRLHQLLFRHNKPLWALTAGGMDANGRPLPPPRIGSGTGDETVELDDNDIVKLPGMAELNPLIPPIAYADALAVLNAQLDEIAKDLPELAYFELRNMGELSGRAARVLLGDAIDRLNEARGNAENALARADAMALSVGQAVGLFSPDLGTYDAGSFDHAFAKRSLFAPDDAETAEIVTAWVAAGVPLRTALKRVGWSEKDIAALDTDAQTEKANSASFADALFERVSTQFDQGRA